MATPYFVTGDDILQPVQLKLGGLPFVISDSASVKARLVSLDHTKAYNEQANQSKDSAGANWATSLVTISFPDLTLTDTKFQGDCYIEIQVSDPNKITWFVKVNIVKGHVN